MRHHKVMSSRIKSITYYPSQKILEIEFIEHGTYQYVDVPERVFDTFLAAKSKGRFFDGVIKDKYLCRKIA